VVAQALDSYPEDLDWNTRGATGFHGISFLLNSTHFDWKKISNYVVATGREDSLKCPVHPHILKGEKNISGVITRF
jgi:hypothetical protein